MATRASPAKLHILPGGVSSPGRPAPSDEALVEAFAKGDRLVAEQLYDRVVHVVDGTLYRVLGRRGPDHQDLVQSVFEQLILTLTERRFAGGCSLRGWAATISVHVGLNALRARQRERKVIDRKAQFDFEVQHFRDRGSSEERMTARLDMERLRRLLAQLDPDKATTLVVHDVLGHSLAEIAVMTRSSVAATQSRLVRARRELRKKLERDPEVAS